MQEPQYKILLVEDDLNLGFLLVEFLESEGFVVKLCKDGETAIRSFEKSKYDLCLLDIMLPKVDGFEVAKKIKAADKLIPLIFITARSLREDKFKGYDLGADDYITKPFNEEELLWKIKAILKRSPHIHATGSVPPYPIGLYVFDYTTQSLHFNGKCRRITEKECEILKYFLERKNQIIKREQLLKDIWGENNYFMGRSLDVFITKIRKYLKEDENIKVENVFGVGFIFRMD